MKALLRPAFVLGLSIAVAATSLVGSSSMALAANLSKPLITDKWFDGPVYEGDKPFLNGTFTDGTDEGPYTVDVSWGDGTSEQYTLEALDARTFRVQKTEAYANDLVETIFITVSDPMFSNTKSLPFTVLNAAPSFTLFGLSATDLETGGAVAATATFTDGGAADTHTMTMDWGDGSPTTTTAAVSPFTTDAHTYTAVGDFTVTATVTDNAGATAVATATVSVHLPNVAPVLGSLVISPSSVVDHQELTLSGSFTDPDTADTFTLTVDWGNGASPPQPLGTARSFSVTHVYDAAGPVTITATVEDGDGGRSSSSVDLVVLPSNHAPADLTLDSSVTGSNVLVNASFTDPDADDTHMVTVSWGDGASTTQFLAAGTTTFAASHVYEASDTYTVTATVTDPAGASTNASVQVVVTVAEDSASDVIDVMSTLVRSFDLDWNTQRWLLKKIDDVKDSLVYGNGQVCSANGTLSHIMFFAERNLSVDQYAALSALATKLEAAAGCTSTGSQHPKVQRAATVTTTTVTPAQTQWKDTTTKTAKSDFKRTEGRGSSH